MKITAFIRDTDAFINVTEYLGQFIPRKGDFVDLKGIATKKDKTTRHGSVCLDMFEVESVDFELSRREIIINVDATDFE